MTWLKGLVAGIMVGWTRASTALPRSLPMASSFDGVTELPGEFDIHGGDAGDPLHVDVVKVDLHAVGQGREDGQFMGRIDSFHVQGGIGFGVALGLGLGQGPPGRPPLPR